MEVEATGFSKKMAKQLEKYVEATGGDADETELAGEEDFEHDFEQEDFQENNDEPAADAVAEGRADALTTGDGSIPQDPQVDDPRLAEELGSLSVEDSQAPKDSESIPANLGTMPLELSHDPDVVARKVKSKKKAAGWAI